MKKLLIYPAHWHSAWRLPPVIPQTRLIVLFLLGARAQQLPMSPPPTKLNRRVPWRRAGHLGILPSHQTQPKVRRRPLPSRRIPSRLPNRKAQKATESTTTPQTEPETKPAEPSSEPENSCAGAEDARVVADKVLEYINSFRTSPAVKLPGLTSYAEYRSRQLIRKFCA